MPSYALVGCELDGFKGSWADETNSFSESGGYRINGTERIKLLAKL